MTNYCRNHSIGDDHNPCDGIAKPLGRAARKGEVTTLVDPAVALKALPEKGMAPGESPHSNAPAAAHRQKEPFVVVPFYQQLRTRDNIMKTLFPSHASRLFGIAGLPGQAAWLVRQPILRPCAK